MEFKENNLEQYLNSFYGFEDGKLGEIQKNAMDNNIPIIPIDTARFLTTILCIKKPKKILEIGCAVGFSSSLFSSYINEGHIITIEKNPKMIIAAKENYKKLGIENKITLLEGDAEQVLKIIDCKFDVIFMDAAKGQYINILPTCLNLLEVGGILIADDVLQRGTIANDIEGVEKRQRTIYRRMRSFLEEITKNEALHTTIVPLGDGVVLSYKLKETV